MTEAVKAARTAYAAAIEWQDRICEDTTCDPTEYDETVVAVQLARQALAKVAGDRCPECGGSPALRDPSNAWSSWGHCVVMENGNDSEENNEK